MTIQIIGFPDAVAQDLAGIFDGNICEADAWQPSVDCDLCIVDQSYADTLIDRLGDAGQPAIIVGNATAAALPSHIEFMVMPFRLSALRQKADRLIASHQAIMLGRHWQFYPDYRYLSSDENERIELTDKESDLLHQLYQAYPEAIEKEQLLKEVWGYDETVDTKTLETHIYRLRSKLEPLLSDGMELKTTDVGYGWAQK